MTEQRGLRAQILTGKHSSANGGISEQVTEVTLVGPQFPELFAPSESAPAVQMVVRNLGGQTVVHFEPVASRPEGHVGYMASGAHVHSSDSRFSEAVGFHGAVSLHDRTESQALYNALSS